MKRIGIGAAGLIKTAGWFGASALVFETGNIIVAFGRSIGNGELTVVGAVLGVMGRAWQLGAVIPTLAGINEAVETLQTIVEKK